MLVAPYSLITRKKAEFCILFYFQNWLVWTYFIDFWSKKESEIKTSFNFNSRTQTFLIDFWGKKQKNLLTTFEEGHDIEELH